MFQFDFNAKLALLFMQKVVRLVIALVGLVMADVVKDKYTAPDCFVP